MARYVTVRNVTRGTTLAASCRIASTIRDRTVGLLGTDHLAQGTGLYIERSPSIHMFFMRYPIDVAFVDAAGVIRRSVEALRPWRVVWWARGARDCIELPVGALQASRSRVGDRLELIEPVAHGEAEAPSRS